MVILLMETVFKLILTKNRLKTVKKTNYGVNEMRVDRNRKKKSGSTPIEYLNI